MTKQKIGFTLAIPAVLFAAQLSAAAPEQRDSTSEQIAQTMMKAMGGQDAWMRAHFVRFDFKVTAGGKVVVNRFHLWDKQTGRYRLEDKTKDGKATVALFNIGNQQGTAYVDGIKLDGAPAAKALKDAYATFINDIYWLAMPWKWLDPGVHLKYKGKKTLGNKSDDVVELSFDKVGLTPGDRYQAYVSPQSHLMEHWAYTLENGEKGAWDWQYTSTGGIKLGSNHTSATGESIQMGDVRVTDTADDALFTDPKKALK